MYKTEKTKKIKNKTEKTRTHQTPSCLTSLALALPTVSTLFPKHLRLPYFSNLYPNVIFSLTSIMATPLNTET